MAEKQPHPACLNEAVFRLWAELHFVSNAAAQQEEAPLRHFYEWRARWLSRASSLFIEKASVCFQSIAAGSCYYR